MRVPVLALICLLLPAAAARACAAALVLAMDVSGSVDPAEYVLQREGVAAALRDPVLAGVLVQDRVALAVVQWSAQGQQALAVPWRRMGSAAAVADFAREVLAMPRAFAGADTAVGAALGFAMQQFADVPECRRRIVDLSGDGDENSGFTLPAARAAAIAAGVEVNGLAIESMGQAISNFYRNRVVTPRGFVETARGHLDFARATHAKMLRELTRPAS